MASPGEIEKWKNYARELEMENNKLSKNLKDIAAMNKQAAHQLNNGAFTDDDCSDDDLGILDLDAMSSLESLDEDAVLATMNLNWKDNDLLVDGINHIIYRETIARHCPSAVLQSSPIQNSSHPVIASTPVPSSKRRLTHVLEPSELTMAAARYEPERIGPQSRGRRPEPRVPLNDPDPDQPADDTLEDMDDSGSSFTASTSLRRQGTFTKADAAAYRNYNYGGGGDGNSTFTKSAKETFRAQKEQLAAELLKERDAMLLVYDRGGGDQLDSTQVMREDDDIENIHARAQQELESLRESFHQQSSFTIEPNLQSRSQSCQDMADQMPKRNSSLNRTFNKDETPNSRPSSRGPSPSRHRAAATSQLNSSRSEQRIDLGSVSTANPAQLRKSGVGRSQPNIALHRNPLSERSSSASRFAKPVTRPTASTTSKPAKSEVQRPVTADVQPRHTGIPRPVSRRAGGSGIPKPGARR